jgi:LysM repeat protein
MVHLEEFNDYKGPRRRPWLLLFILVIIGLGVWWAISHKPTEKKSAEKTDIKSVEKEKAIVGVKKKDKPAPLETKVSAPIHNVDVKLLVVDADKALKRGDLIAARNAYLTILDKSIADALRHQVEEKLGAINIKLVMSPLPMPHNKVVYLVKSGDFLGKIARKTGSTVELIQKSNKLDNPNKIKKGDRLLILKGIFSIEVSKTRNDLILRFNNQFFKRYSVATGKFGKTPVGTFKITEKMKEPVWWSPDGKEFPYGDPKNILGTRWMTLRATGKTPDARGYGIHGTWLENSIGKQASAGCIRMHNSDVEELYTLVPGGTKVVINE